MATIKAFCGIRPQEKYVQNVAALPYDVMNEVEAREITKDNPYSFLHIDRSEVDMPVGTDPHHPTVYQKAAATLNKMITDGIFITDDVPCLYIYQLVRNGIPQTGLVACTSVDEYIDGTIKKHEYTVAAKEEDRINHVDYCDANTGPIFLAYKQDNSSQQIIEKFISENKPVYNFVADDKVTHTVWVIKNPDICQKLTLAFEKIPNLYIADGHHRNASACAVALKRRQANPNYTGQEEYNYYLSVLFPAEQLNILDYNRVVYDLNNYTKEEFLNEVKKIFDVKEYNSTGCYTPEKPHTFGMYLDNQWYVLTADPASIPKDPVNSLDVAILQHKLLTPILNIDDPRTNNRIDFIGGIRGLTELEKRVNALPGSVAFSMYPTTMAELMNVADSGNVMPPKSTWFEPKLRSGLFIHKLS